MLKILFCFFIFLGLSSFNFAYSKSDVQSPDNLLSLSLEDLLNIKVHSSTLSDISVRHAPSSVTVFTQQQINEMGIDSIEELLNFVPGFQSSREVFIGDGYRVGVRGSVNPQTTFNILFMINGKRINGDLAGGALFENRHITVANVEKVEVIRGPGSALYGTNAFLGVVNIITKKQTNELHIAKGNLDSIEMYSNVSIQKQDWSVSGFVRYYEDNGQLYGAELTTPINPNVLSTQDPYSAFDISGTISWKQDITLEFRHMERELNDFFVFREVDNDLVQANSKQDSISLNIEHTIDQSWLLEAQINYLSGELITVEPLNNLIGSYEYNASEWEFAFKAHYYDFSDHTLTLGLSYRQPEVNKWQFESNDKLVNIPLGSLEHRSYLGLYLQDEYTISEYIHTTLGLRADYISEQDTNLNPRAALVYTPDNKSTFKLIYGTAFRAPNRFQLDDLFLSNKNIKAEEIETTELVWLQDFTSNTPTHIQSAVSLFYSQHKNFISAIPGEGEFGLVLINSQGILYTAGIETELNIQYSKTLSSNMAYTAMLNMDENPQSHPRDIFSITTTYRENNWFANVNALYKSSTTQTLEVGEVTLSDYWVFNTNIGLNLGRGLKINGKIHNLTNAKYYSPSIIETMTLGIENRGRTFSVGVTYEF